MRGGDFAGGVAEQGGRVVQDAHVHGGWLGCLLLDGAHVGVGVLALVAEVDPVEIADRGDLAERGAEHRGGVVLVDARGTAGRLSVGLDNPGARRGCRLGAGEVGVVVGAQGLDAAHLGAEQRGGVGLVRRGSLELGRGRLGRRAGDDGLQDAVGYAVAEGLQGVEAGVALVLAHACRR